MIRIKEVNTGEEIQLNLNDINIDNFREKEWNVLEGKDKLESHIIRIIKDQHLKSTGKEMDKPVTSSLVRVTKYYCPDIGFVNF